MILAKSSSSAKRPQRKMDLSIFVVRRALTVLFIAAGTNTWFNSGSNLAKASDVNSPEVVRMLRTDGCSSYNIDELFSFDSKDRGPFSLLDRNSESTDDSFDDENVDIVHKDGYVRYDELPRMLCPWRDRNDDGNESMLPASDDFIKKKALKTGTTIVGCVADGGKCVVLAADTRATEGESVADKRCEKIHVLARNVWCCGAGTSGDIDALVTRCKYNLMLRGMRHASIGNVDGGYFDYFKVTTDEYDDSHQARLLERLPVASVSESCKFIRDELYKGQGHIGANLVLGGFDYASDEAILVAIHPHSSLDRIPYTALGSGSLAAMAVLESRYEEEISEEEAIVLVKDAVYSGIRNDLGSGSQIDLCIIKKDSVTYRRGVVPEEELPHQHIQGLESRLVQGEENEMEGVNGFGSLPYKVKSTRIIRVSEDKEQRDYTEWLKRKLKL
mmetsp:Transcript_19677/g.25507  ORF Transcript_19677/g.25507 Transcript_19677/m.25507 type:complete len:445 (-) Transcript_19677:88-1422(-)